MRALFGPISALLLTLIVFFFIWTNKEIINQLFPADDSKISRFRDFLAQVWPTLILFGLFSLWVVYSFHVFVGNTYLAQQLVPTWWILVAFPIIDRLIFTLLSQLNKSSLLQSRTFEERSQKFNRRILNGVRLIMATIAIVQLFKGLGLNIWAMVEESVLEKIITATIEIAILLFLAYLFWEIIQSFIERQLPEEPTDTTDFDSEGGKGGATRAETLLPLVRYSVATVLLIIVVFSALDIMGVQIMPLIASAGVVGIAIGFGAQKLVQDVISGFFFLVDDAFRRGEYIEVAGMRGTVERISVRSMRLRHHRGAVQTIPFGEIATVSNLSRDWFTMKLEFRLPYDVDLEKVRKIIKKVGEAMLENEEYGQNFILPLKSQGVIRIEESTLILRVKFTCKPGEQWVLRRETYRLIKEGLEKAGIHFAHRAVHVLAPELEKAEGKDQDQSPDKETLIKAAGSAVLTSDLEKQDIAKHDKFDDE
jgi:small-conductance mechanosensitive channel